MKNTHLCESGRSKGRTEVKVKVKKLNYLYTVVFKSTSLLGHVYETNINQR